MAKKIGKLIVYEIIAVIVIPYFVPAIGQSMFNALDRNSYYRNWLTPYNADAKLIFTNTATYCLKSEVSGTLFPDGVYIGVLESGDEDFGYASVYNGSHEDLEKSLVSLMGGEDDYYFVKIKDHYPVLAYWSRQPQLLEYADYLAYKAEIDDDGSENCPDGVNFGCYPYEIGSHGNTDIVKYKDSVTPQNPVQSMLTDKDIRKLIFTDKLKNGLEITRGILFCVAVTQFPLAVYLIIGRIKAKKQRSDNDNTVPQDDID